jgi:ureidoglycolate hydrolase
MTLRGFTCSLDAMDLEIQGINYKPGIWHHPMVVLGNKTVDFMNLTWERRESSLTPDEDTQEYYFPTQDFELWIS